MDQSRKSWETILDGPIVIASKENLDPFKFFENICYQNLIQDIAFSPNFSSDSISELELFKGVSKSSFHLEEEEETEDNSSDEERADEPNSQSLHNVFLIDDVLSSTKKVKKVKVLNLKESFEHFLLTTNNSEELFEKFSL